MLPIGDRLTSTISEMFCWGRDLGEANAVNAVERLVAERADQTPALGDRLGAVVDGRISPYALFPPARVARWVAAALVQGRSEVIAPFLATALRAFRVRLELRRRRQFLAGVIGVTRERGRKRWGLRSPATDGCATTKTLCDSTGTD